MYIIVNLIHYWNVSEHFVQSIETIKGNKMKGVSLLCDDIIPSFNYSFLSSSSRLKLKGVCQIRKSFCSSSNVAFAPVSDICRPQTLHVSHSHCHSRKLTVNRLT